MSDAADNRVATAGCCLSPERLRAARREPSLAPLGGVAPDADIVWIEGGASFVGTDASQLPVDGEGPCRPVRIKPYGIERHAVTNRRFARFVEETGYATEAEAFGWSFVFRAFAADEVAASAVAAPEAPWWLRIDGADWAHPEGPDTDVVGREDHPVVHVSWRDAKAFARWAGGRLPSEAEWEHAARGGRDAVYPWGDREPDDEAYFPANIWQGRFPEFNAVRDGFAGTAPVSSFEPNGYGLHNMAGNVWEWCEDAFRVRSISSAARKRNEAARRHDMKVMKGGSYLCHRSYCYRYRIAARMSSPSDTGTGHVGFRVAYDVAGVST